jgi:hypothetical protein
MNDSTFRKIQSVKNDVEADLLKIPGVHGVSIGYKTIKGKRGVIPAIVVHLTKKRPLAKVPPGERIPDSIRGVRTDVIEHGQIKPQVADTNLYNPLFGGCQIQVGNQFGTLGCLVYVGQTLYGLTNQHVVSASGNKVYQPTNSKHNGIGTSGTSILNQYIDAALIQLDGRTGQAKVLRTPLVNGQCTVVRTRGSYTIRPIDIRGRGYQVKKYGRTTGLTIGFVTHLDYTVIKPDGSIMYDQIFISPEWIPFAEAGDSGAVCMDLYGRVVGLFWGVSDSGDVGGGCPIAAVTSALNCTIPTITRRMDSQRRKSHAAVLAVEKFQQERLAPAAPAAIRAWALSNLNASAGGRILAQAFHDHEHELRKLVAGQPQVAAVWARYRGCLLEQLLKNSICGSANPIPIKLGKVMTAKAIDRFFQVVRKYGSARLVRDIPKSAALLHQAPGKTWIQFVAGLTESVKVPMKK